MTDYDNSQMPVPADRPALVYVAGGQSWTMTIVDTANPVGLKGMHGRDRAILRALLTYTLSELDRIEATP